VVPQLGQKIDARRSREFPVENDDVGIGGGVERAEQTLPSPKLWTENPRSDSSSLRISR
jgi:hypothetical protein